MPDHTVDPKWFRQVLGQYPTGVCVVTAAEPEGGQAGLAVGSFTSVSLDPPLVAFLPDKSSTSWPRIERAGRFCVNVLAADQEDVCRAFATKGGDKFEGLSWRPAGTGSPILDGAIAWIDCDLEAVHEAGDHYIVVGRVRELDVANSSLPLLFFQGGYGRFVPQSLVTADLELLDHFRQVDLVRHELEALARSSGVECNAAVLAGDEVVIIASAGQPRGRHIPTRVGHRFAFTPPVGAPFVAWAGEDAVEAWLQRAKPELTPSERQRYDETVEWVRSHGYLLLVGRLSQPADQDRSETSAVSPRDLRRFVRDLHTGLTGVEVPDDPSAQWATISAPTFDANANVSLTVNLYGFEGPFTAADLKAHADRLTAAAQRVTALVGGRRPD